MGQTNKIKNTVQKQAVTLKQELQVNKGRETIYKPAFLQYRVGPTPVPKWLLNSHQYTYAIIGESRNTYKF